MIDWDKIVESRVVDTFRDVCYKWWSMDVQFYDEKGRCKSKDIDLQNPFCNLMRSKTNGTKHCIRNYKKYRKELNKSLKPFICKCYAGLNGITVPLFVKENYVGTMVGSGIKNPGQQIDTAKLTMFGLDKAELEQCYEKLKPTNDHSETYIIDFMEFVAKDAMAFYELLQEKEEAVKRQATLQEKTYYDKYKGIIGTSQSMKKIFNSLDLIEDSESPVLIEGETGTGKELIAAAIHYNSPRRNKMFVIQNCCAFSDTLLSSELFGHEKGSFTGAVSEKKGLFEIADEGTLFLDEIGDMNLEVQAKLLRVLENGTFCRVGGTEQKKVDARIIVATNKELSSQVKRGLFRKDLFYRINTILIKLPPLREREEDILPLANYFLDCHAGIRNIEKKEICHEVVRQLLLYNWPGNVRELKNVIERLIILSGKETRIERKHVPIEIMAGSHLESSATENGRGSNGLQHSLNSLARKIIEDELNRIQWNKTIVARKLGMSRASLNNRIAQFNIQQEKR